MGLTLITPASGSPVSLAETKLLCRMEDGSADAELGLLLPAAVSALGEWIGQPLGQEVWELTLDAFSPAIELPKGPVSGSVTVRYVDPAGATLAADPAIYSVDLVSKPKWVVLNQVRSWPAVMDAVNVVRIEFTAGYSALTLPAPIKLAVAALVKHWFENGAEAGLPAGVTELCSPWRSLWIWA